ncbi:MAG: gamma-glutamyltransferase [Persicimonas sp.]
MTPRTAYRLASLLLAAAFVCEATPAAADSSDERNAPHVESPAGVVAADHAEASRVGAEVLSEGGNAVDAGVASLLANGVLNPHASGLGGGGFCLYRAADDDQVEVLDFRERAPEDSTEDMYVVDGKVDRKRQLRGGLAIGVPGEPAGLWVLQNRHGELTWSETVDPSVELAAEGYPVGELLEERLDKHRDDLEEASPALAEQFQVDDRWAEAGDELTRPGLAKTLEMLRDEGPMPFYHGEIGRAIVDGVEKADGIISRDDLRTYQVAHRDPVAGQYRDYEIYSMPPPSSGGTALVETLNILEGFGVNELGRGADSYHLIIESLKHAFADRARWMGDTDFVDVPIERLTSEEYADKLRAKIDKDGVLPTEEYGTHPQIEDDEGTSHVSVIDKERNMLACTSSINTSFGSMVYIDEYGLLLNNHMGDFAAQPGEPNAYGLVEAQQNAVAPKKRPLSSMSPTLVMRDDRPFMATGASGGPTIITGTLWSILNQTDFGMSAPRAIAAPRLHHQWKPEKLSIEPNMGSKDRLEELGHNLDVGPAFNSVQVVVEEDGKLVGVSDPRKKGEPAAADVTPDEP